MFSRLDVVAFAAWLLMGSVMVENSHRIDRAATQAAETAVTCQPDLRISAAAAPFVVSVALAGDGAAAYVHALSPATRGCGGGPR